MRTKMLKQGSFLLLASLLFVAGAGTPAQAQGRHLGICVEWNPDFGTFDCDPATPALEIGTTGDLNPNFSIAMNGVGENVHVYLLVLLPGADSSLGFTANFNGGGDVAGEQIINFSEGFLISGNLSVLNSDFLSVSEGADWHFNSINALSVVEGNAAFTVHLFDTGLTLDGGGGTIQVSFSNFTNGTGFEPGTFFLGFGEGSWVGMPLTQGVQTVPEPGSLLLLSFGLAGLGFAGFMRRRQNRRA